MTRPYKHPSTGIYWVRKVVPVPLRAKVGKRELKVTLGTKDASVAKVAALEVLERFNRILAKARTGASEQPTERQLNVLVGKWYDAEARKYVENPSAGPDWAVELDYYTGMFQGDVGGAEIFSTDRAFLHATETRLRSHYPDADHASARHLARHWAAAWVELARAMLRRIGGDWTRDTTPDRFERPRMVAAVVASTTPLSIRGLFEGWKATTASKARTIAEARYAVEALVTFLTHDDALKVTPADLIRYRAVQREAKLTHNTWNNRLSQISQVFHYGVQERSLGTNPGDGLRLPKSTPLHPLPYTDDDARRILVASRLEEGPSRRWAHWVMAFSGMRVGEVLQLTRGDVREADGIWFMAVHEDDEGKSVKTGISRNVPMHPALIAEGFLAYVQTIAGDDPIFHDKALDQHGNRGGRAWNVVGKWVRTTVGLTDDRKAPNHSWRHRMEDELRVAEVPEEARDAIVGHARKTTGRSYGIRGEALGRLHRYLSRIPVPVGLVVEGMAISAPD